MIKVRLVETDVLWLQEQEARRRLPFIQVLGAESIADLMTKNLTAGVIKGYLTKMKLRYAEGRSDIAQQLHGVSGASRCRLSLKGRSENNEVLGLGGHTSCNNSARTPCNNFMCAVRCFDVE